MNEQGPCPNYAGTYSIAGDSGHFFKINAPESDWHVLLAQICVLQKNCEISDGRCGFVGMARDMNSYEWLKKEELKTHQIGDIMLGVLAGIIILWFYWAIKSMIVDDKNARICKKS